MLLSEMSRKSEVWKYFDFENDGNRVVCRLFKSKLVYHHSTSDMLNHVKYLHVGITLTSELLLCSQPRSVDGVILPDRRK